MFDGKKINDLLSRRLLELWKTFAEFLEVWLPISHSSKEPITRGKISK
jgi:hypothetical protein